MMKTTNCSAISLAKLEEIGVPSQIAQRVEMTRDNEKSIDGNMRATLEFTYIVVSNGFEKRKVTGSINAPANRIDKILSDRKEMATFIALGMNATPVKERIELPEWILEMSEHKYVLESMGKASCLADANLPTQ